MFDEDRRRSAIMDNQAILIKASGIRHKVIWTFERIRMLRAGKLKPLLHFLATMMLNLHLFQDNQEGNTLNA